MRMDISAEIFQLLSRNSGYRITVGIIPRPGSEGGPEVDCSYNDFASWHRKFTMTRAVDVVKGLDHIRFDKPPAKKAT